MQWQNSWEFSKFYAFFFWRWWNIFKDDPRHKIPWLLDFVHLPYSHCNTKNSINLAWFLILNIKKSTSIPFSCATRDLLQETRIWTEAGGMFAEACQSLLRSCTSQMDITPPTTTQQQYYGFWESVNTSR